jgi:hypothetical protein
LLFWPWCCSYIDDGFVTIGAFLAKIKADFEKIIGSEVKVVQGESIPSSMTSQCVLCIHNLTPVEKVDPTWTVSFFSLPDKNALHIANAVSGAWTLWVLLRAAIRWWRRCADKRHIKTAIKTVNTGGFEHAWTRHQHFRFRSL